MRNRLSLCVALEALRMRSHGCEPCVQRGPLAGISLLDGNIMRRRRTGTSTSRGKAEKQMTSTREQYPNIEGPKTGQMILTGPKSNSAKRCGLLHVHSLQTT
jgi:hypothetical protein